MSSAPVRYPSGVTQDRVWQPLGLIGQPNPFHYMTMYDDFTYWVAGRYTVTNTGNGTVAASAGDGGRILFTTNSTTPATTDISAIQTDSAAMTLDLTKKMAFMCRVQLADATNAALNAGKIQTTATPFTVTDGIYFNKPTGSTQVTLRVVSGSAVQASYAIPTATFAMANATYADLAWAYDGHQYLDIYAGYPLVGGGAVKGLVGTIDISGLTLSAANLAGTLALQSGTASSKTMLADFFYAAKER